MRIGQGYDAHRFAADRRLMLGGVEVEYDLGLAAHSDGDVLIHALCDALLGAAGQGDIGRHFPDSSEEFKDIDSRILLRRVVDLLHGMGLQVHNMDCTIVAQAPKLAPHIPTMQKRLAADLQVAESRINIKATTTEGMGFAGRGEGIASYAMVLLDE
ncbi:MAG: 2-C-methyl-D-erythritol 2,4-cyclodiphosphate synthase [Candidatus Polarisedimenticolaceae bacterium]|nr:2-C-methyl-D-erythritol 2,4-cyclodiphosphate synthase [Candidatus Polarisedimenticolaceae bacterium]